MNDAAAPRPSVPMSQEEHGVLSKLTTAIEVLAAGQRRTEDTLGKFIDATDSRFTALTERGRLSRGDVLAFISAALALAGVITALLSMRIDAALAPLQTQNQVSIVDRAGLRDDVEHIKATVTAGREARLLAEKETSNRLAVNDERTREIFYALHHHYPSAP